MTLPNLFDPSWMGEASRRRFWARVDDSGDGCWEWTGWRKDSGYGSLVIRGKKHAAHRISYQLTHGLTDRALDLDHLCRNRACVRPDHLEPVTRAINLRRGAEARITHCPHGHAYTEDNIYWDAGSRKCRTCSKARANARYHRLKEAA